MAGTSAAELIRPSLEKICEAAGGRKHTKLRHEAKVGIRNFHISASLLKHTLAAD